MKQARICLFIFERQGRCSVVRALVSLDCAAWDDAAGGGAALTVSVAAVRPCRRRAGRFRRPLRRLRVARRVACVGTLTLRIPKLRSGSFLPEDVIERYQRVDRALVAAVAEMCATVTSTRKVQRVAEKMGESRLSKDQPSAIASSLDADIEELCGRLLGGSPVPYVWHEATYVKRREGRMDGPQEGQPRVVYDGVRLEAESRGMLRSVLELTDRAETAWGINRISGSGMPGRLASVQALRQLSQHYRPL